MNFVCLFFHEINNNNAVYLWSSLSSYVYFPRKYFTRLFPRIMSMLLISSTHLAKLGSDTKAAQNLQDIHDHFGCRLHPHSARDVYLKYYIMTLLIHQTALLESILSLFANVILFVLTVLC